MSDKCDPAKKTSDLCANIVAMNYFLRNAPVDFQATCAEPLYFTANSERETHTDASKEREEKRMKMVVIQTKSGGTHESGVVIYNSVVKWRQIIV